jgi:methylmalonyl-CoA mutase N-terminal domain/subunit
MKIVLTCNVLKISSDKYCTFYSPEVIVGVNKYQLHHEDKLEVRVVDNTKVKQSQINRLKQVRATRDNKKVNQESSAGLPKASEARCDLGLFQLIHKQNLNSFAKIGCREWCSGLDRARVTSEQGFRHK